MNGVVGWYEVKVGPPRKHANKITVLWLCNKKSNLHISKFESIYYISFFILYTIFNFDNN